MNLKKREIKRFVCVAPRDPRKLDMAIAGATIKGKPFTNQNYFEGCRLSPVFVESNCFVKSVDRMLSF